MESAYMSRDQYHGIVKYKIADTDQCFLPLPLFICHMKLLFPISNCGGKKFVSVLITIDNFIFIA